MKVLVASVTNAEPEVLRAHLRTVNWQVLPPGWEMDLLYVADVEMCSDHSIALLKDAGATVVMSDPKPEQAHYEVGERTHDWSIPSFYWLAEQKEKILQVARDRHYDAVWLVDSDLLCGRDTLSSLIHADKPVVSAVFWTRWVPEADPMPQVWLQHPYGFNGRGMEAQEFLLKMRKRQLVRVSGLGACTLIRGTVLDRVAFWPPLEHLPQEGMWQGEDRHFCIRAERNHIELWADAWPEIFHVYRPSDRERISDVLEAFLDVEEGRLLSFTVEPCEEPHMIGYKEHVRGMDVQMLPELVEALEKMPVGDERLVGVEFPSWYPIAEYRGKDKVMRVKLLGCRQERGVWCA